MQRLPGVWLLPPSPEAEGSEGGLLGRQPDIILQAPCPSSSLAGSRTEPNLQLSPWLQGPNVLLSAPRSSRRNAGHAQAGRASGAEGLEF